ncbi:MAG TPA: tol-pal system protein YbgF, partial [Candidatus Binatia bacterium]
SHQMDLRIGQSSLQDNQKAANLDSRITRMDDELRAQGALLRAREQELQVLREAVLRAASGGVDTAALQREPPSSPASTQPGMVDPARSDYEEAWRHLEKKEYRDAIARMNEFIKKHPESDYADNAQYWIGESYYALKQFDQAILEFDAVRRKYPKGDKVPAALLKQGFAFAELGDKVDARLILQELIARYPETPEAVKAQEKVKALES